MSDPDYTSPAMPAGLSGRHCVLLMKYNTVSRIAVFGFMNPVIGVILSALILGEENQAFTISDKKQQKRRQIWYNVCGLFRQTAGIMLLDRLLE